MFGARALSWLKRGAKFVPFELHVLTLIALLGELSMVVAKPMSQSSSAGAHGESDRPRVHA